jgi:hypothetical protein
MAPSKNPVARLRHLLDEAGNSPRFASPSLVETPGAAFERPHSSYAYAVTLRASDGPPERAADAIFNTISTGCFRLINVFVRSLARRVPPPRHQEIANHD